MSYVTLYNPTELDLVLHFKGDKYFLDREQTKEFPKNVADQFVLIYGFLEEGSIKEPTKSVATPKKEVEKVVEKKVKKTKKK